MPLLLVPALILLLVALNAWASGVSLPLFVLAAWIGAQWIADLSVSYKPDQQWAITVGADNVLDSYPDRSLFINSTSGMFPYSNYSPAGFNGAYVYGRVNYTW